ncbi:hypothetical protein FI667_g4552, partial [Globisporangium splendens]
MVSPARALPYEGIDANWEEQQFQSFRQQARANATPVTYAEFLFGRLLEEDLHLSCRPMLPPNVGELHGVTIQGMCILQVVDIVNIGANFEQRKEDSRGPTRTLKICFTDGHQLVYGFEYRWLPTFSMAILHGTKASGARSQQQAGKATSSWPESASVINAGAYSAALVTAQFTAAASAPSTPRKRPAVNPQVGVQSPPGRHPAIPVSAQPHHLSVASVAAVAMASNAGHASYASSSVQAFAGHSNQHSEPTPGSLVSQQQQCNGSATATVPPPVFVDAISDEDCDSDMTDPMVEHLFYSPNTPRIPADSRDQAAKSRKRPREAATSAIRVTELSNARAKQETQAGAGQAHTGINRHDPPSSEDVVIINKEDDDGGGESAEAFSFSLLDATSLPAADTPQFDPSSPFQYFSARSKHLSATDNLVLDEVLHIRACIKSVAGFQFNTGSYLLKVIIEDCTETKEVSVDSKFVERLMGVPCLEFMRAMQATPAVAHRWAAQMQFALMTLEGIMEFRMNPNGTFTLLNCRDFNQQDTKALLQRVKASMAR